MTVPLKTPRMQAARLVQEPGWVQLVQEPQAGALKAQRWEAAPELFEPVQAGAEVAKQELSIKASCYLHCY